MRRGAIAGAVAGLVFAAWKFLESRAPDTAGLTYEPQPFPMPPRPVPHLITSAPSAARSADPVPDDTVAFVAPGADGTCPVSHPIKGKMSSGIYHQPGGFAYDRTHADRCYLNATAAESDGLRAAKR